tara:strand:- start:5202 stop:5615 length:414 start_codon:yes stop_codon:yes gene_type:complete
MKGFKLNFLISIILILVTSYLLLTRCVCNDKIEEMATISSSLNDNDSDNQVSGHNWRQMKQDSLDSTQDDNFFSRLSNHESGQIPLPEGILNFFYANKFDAACCLKPQNYSSSTGCACISEEQMRFLNERGGNNVSF